MEVLLAMLWDLDGRIALVGYYTVLGYLVAAIISGQGPRWFLDIDPDERRAVRFCLGAFWPMTLAVGCLVLIGYIVVSLVRYLWSVGRGLRGLARRLPRAQIRRS